MGGFSIGYGLGLKQRRLFDQDALLYFENAGITDILAKTQINNFILEIKSLGLWGNMVCWPLRATQNATTGTTVYSFGGLGSYDGTTSFDLSLNLFSDGIDLSNAARKLITTSLSLNQPSTIFSVFKYNLASGVQVVYGKIAELRLFRLAATSSTTRVFAGTNISTGSYTSSLMRSYQNEFNGASSTYSLNGASKITINPGSNNLSLFTIGDVDSGVVGAYISFIAVFNLSGVPLLHSTYKSTIGQELGLV